MNGGAGRARQPILLEFLDPTHPYPTILLTGALGVFPRAWAGGEREKRKEEQRPGENKFCFNLKIRHWSLHQNTHAAASTNSHTAPPSLESLSLAFKRVSLEPREELKIPQT